MDMVSGQELWNKSNTNWKWLYILANFIRLAYDGEYNFEEMPISLWT